MLATAFDQENCVLDAPESMGVDQCEPLSVWQGKLLSGFEAVISCWKPTKEEIEQLQKTGRIWLIVYGKKMPPVSLQTVSPFESS